MKIDTRYDIGERVFVYVQEREYVECECCGSVSVKSEKTRKEAEIVDARFVRHRSEPNNVEVAYGVKVGTMTYLVREDEIEDFR